MPQVQVVYINKISTWGNIGETKRYKADPQTDWLLQAQHMHGLHCNITITILSVTKTFWT